MSEIKPELVERMVALVERAANIPDGGEIWLRSNWLSQLVRHAADIAAELPQTVDPDLVEARKITVVPASDYEHVNDKIRRGHWLNGVYDNDPMIQIALAAIKRGRELAVQS